MVFAGSRMRTGAIFALVRRDVDMSMLDVVPAGSDRFLHRTVSPEENLGGRS